jgi:hypothetical protein
MNSELLTKEGITLFIATPIVLLAIGLWHMYKYSVATHFKYFLAALTLFLLGFTTGGESTAYRYPAQKISDQNFSLFYSNDLNYKVISDNKRWDNIQGDILVIKARNTWGAEISESVTVVPIIKQ